MKTKTELEKNQAAAKKLKTVGWVLILPERYLSVCKCLDRMEIEYDEEYIEKPEMYLFSIK